MKNNFKKSFGILGISLAMLFLVNIASAQNQTHPVPNGPTTQSGQTKVTTDHNTTGNMINPSASQAPVMMPSTSIPPVPVKSNSDVNSNSGSHPASNPHFIAPVSQDANGNVKVTLKDENGNSKVVTGSKPTVTLDSNNKPSSPQAYTTQFKLWMSYNKDFMNFLSEGQKAAFNQSGVAGVYNFDLTEAFKSTHKN